MRHNPLFPHFWKGEWLNDEQLSLRLNGLGEELRTRSSERLSLDCLLEACEGLRAALNLVDHPLRLKLASELHEGAGLPETEIDETLKELAAFISREHLLEKIARELSAGEARHFPFRLERTNYRDSVFEAWLPLGFLVHIAPTNAINVSFLSVLEGLLSGNVNFIKTGGSDSLYAQLCLEALCSFDPSGTLASFIFAARISSSRKDLLKTVLAEADGVAVWGSEEAVESIRTLSPAHARLIAWGPKISFAYVERTRVGDDTVLEALAQDVCLLEQQACSSPQVAYVEASTIAELEDFARRLGKVLERVSASQLRKQPSAQEQAEITQTIAIARMESALEPENPLRVIEGDGWRILLDGKVSLRASPLYRTIWIKALSREQIVATLRPLRHYLQTVGLSSPPESLYEISQALFAAGVLRITPLGQMLGGYMGEPHDGVYALQRYSRRVSVMNPELPAGISALEELAPQAARTTRQPARAPLQNKTDLAARKLDARDCEFYVKSGGSSGEPQLSIFTYDDYHIQMKLAAQGLFAAGLEPSRDRCMNLFFGGGLYGGFLSFFTILEELKAVQFPMAANADSDFIVKIIAEQNVNTMLGMPSYLWSLFQKHDAFFASHKPIEKLFYGGEHFAESQRRLLKERYGVKLIRSATYGSNDTGPMGYQCPHCEGSVHHLHERLQTLEILKTDRDEPVSGPENGCVKDGEVGRLVLTSKVRRGQNLARYEIGDLGRWVFGPCGCGRQAPRFELLGRYGDIFKIGGMFLNVAKFTRILDATPGFSGEFQLHLEDPDRLTLLVSNPTALNLDEVRLACLKEYADLAEAVEADQTLGFFVEQLASESLVRTAGSGKLRKILDQRRI